MRKLEAFGFLVERMMANVLNIVLPKLHIYNGHGKIGAKRNEDLYYESFTCCVSGTVAVAEANQTVDT